MYTHIQIFNEKQIKTNMSSQNTAGPGGWSGIYNVEVYTNQFHNTDSLLMSNRFPVYKVFVKK